MADGLESLRELRELAHLYGVQTSYNDAMGRHIEAGAEALLAVLVVSAFLVRASTV